MDPAVETALDTDKVIDITTTGRKSGEPKRIEIWFHRQDGNTYITGTPGRRDWYANLAANPSFTFHLKGSHHADLPATARAITEEAERREVFSRLVPTINADYDVDQWVSGAPLVEVTFDA
jgi:deazaflavin-dependent oxidoreductase (nitroreductase family)